MNCMSPENKAGYRLETVLNCHAIVKDFIRPNIQLHLNNNNNKGD